MTRPLGTIVNYSGDEFDAIGDEVILTETGSEMEAYIVNMAVDKLKPGYLLNQAVGFVKDDRICERGRALTEDMIKRIKNVPAYRRASCRIQVLIPYSMVKVIRKY